MTKELANQSKEENPANAILTATVQSANTMKPNGKKCRQQLLMSSHLYLGVTLMILLDSNENY